jgi:hypothetical protein
MENRKRQIRSFIFVLYDGNLEECAIFDVPISVGAPFANRLFREILPDREVLEPWYVLLHRFASELPYQRATYPVGLTSLYSTRYAPEEEPPPRVTLHPDALVQYFTVHLLDFQEVLYRGDYSVDDIFRAGAEFLARGLIEKDHMKAEDGPFYYAIVPSTEEVRRAPPELFPPEAYEVEGVFRLPLLAEDRQRTIFHRVPSPPLEEKAPIEGGEVHAYGTSEPGSGRVLMHAGVYRQLKEHLELDSANEEGGYLLGQPYRQPGSAEDEEGEAFRWWIEITDLIQGEGTWGTPAMLLFTGDTWSAVSRRLDRDYADKKLVAWFHTHVFAPSESFGLSGMDQDLHRRHLGKPWQVAVLVNIDSDGERTVRCFQRGPEGDLFECPFEVIEEEGENNVG